MLGLLLIYFIGKKFYYLANDYNKLKWLYVILGIVMYYVGTFFCGVVVALVNPSLLEGNDNFLLAILAMPFGIASCSLFYFILYSIWKRNHINIEDEIDNMGKEVPNN